MFLQRVKQEFQVHFVFSMPFGKYRGSVYFTCFVEECDNVYGCLWVSKSNRKKYIKVM